MYGFSSMAKLLYFKEHHCLGYYGLITFSTYYVLLVLAMFRALYVLASFVSFSTTESLGDRERQYSGLAYDIGIINDPLDIVDQEVGKFGFKRFIAVLENDPDAFDVEEFIHKNDAPIEHLKAGVDEINGYKYIFVRKLDFTFDNENDDRFKTDNCGICLDGYKDGEKVLSLGDCPHHYHWECIQAWLKKSVKCPICRNCMRKDMLRSISALKKMMV